MGKHKTTLERRFDAQRASVEKLAAAAHGDDATEVMCSFSELDCVVDVKLKDGWVRYALIDGDDEPDELRRIG